MNCPLCFHSKSTVVYPHTRSGRIVQCDRCGFAFADTPPEPGYGDEKKAVFDRQEVYLQNAMHRLSVLKEATGIEGGSLLDVGCHHGTFAGAAKALGFEVRGVEPDPEAAAEAESHFGFPVHQGIFEEVEIEGGPFDVISFIHSFEHIPDPHRAAARCRNLLAAKGALLIETPNYDSLFRKATGSKWRQFIRDHSVFYSPGTIRQLFESEGFRVVKTISVPKLLSFSLLADRVERHYSRSLGRGLEKLARATGSLDRSFRLNLGDIMLTLASFKA
jgi:SAM-dependent methyltransferase